MNKKLYTACGAMALVFAACSDDNGVFVGTSTEPNTLALGSSSSENGTLSSSGTIASSSSFVTDNGDLWDPSIRGFSVNVARYAALVPANASPDGHWFVETDNQKGGESSIIWPRDLVSIQDEQIVVDSCKGICGTAVLEKGRLTYDPYAGVGFILAKDDAGNPVPVDMSGLTGVCISYTSEAAPTLELDLGDSVGALLGYASPAVSLPKIQGQVGKRKCFKWSDFEFPAWSNKFDLPEYWTSNVGEKAAKQLVAFRFRISAMPGEYKFNIKGFGTYTIQMPKIGSSSSVETLSSSSISSGPVNSSSSVASAPDGDLWKAYEKNVNVARYADVSWKNLAHGRWFAYTDGTDFSWDDYKAPDDYNNDYLIESMGRAEGFLQTDVSMIDPELGYEPIALFGFKLAQDGADTIPINETSVQIVPNYIPVDISNWGGLCVTYTSTVPISMEIGLGSAYNDSLGYNYTFGPSVMPSVALPVKAADTVACFEWADFKQTNLNRVADGDRFKISGEDAAKRAGEIVFRVTAKVGLSGAFTIKALGTNRE